MYNTRQKTATTRRTRVSQRRANQVSSVQDLTSSSTAKRRKYNKNQTQSTYRSGREHFRCVTCKKGFNSILDFRKHLQDNTSCLENHPFKCGNCSYVGYKKEDLKNHLSKKAVCQYYNKEKKVLTGILPSVDTAKVVNELIHPLGKSSMGDSQDYQSISYDDGHGVHKGFQKPSSSSDGNWSAGYSMLPCSAKTTSFNVSSKLIDGSIIDVTMHITDTTHSEREKLSHHASQKSSSLDIPLSSFYDNSKTLARLSDNQFESRLIFDSCVHDHIDLAPSSTPTSHERDRILSIQERILRDVISEQYVDDIMEEEIAEEIAGSRTTPDNVSVADSTGPMPFDENEDEVLAIDENENDNITNSAVADPSTLTNSLDARQIQGKMNAHHASMNLSNAELVSIDLFHLLRASNAPMTLFDRIISWSKNYHHMIQSSTKEASYDLLSRKSLINAMNKKLNYNELYCHPKVTQLTLSSGRVTSIVTFSARDLILKVVNNKSLFKKENILLNVNNPFEVPNPNSTMFGEVNSGSWHEMAVQNECNTEKSELLMPWCFFIDGLKVDKFGKLTVEAVMASCLWYNRMTRNRSSAWSVLGFVEDQKLFRDYSSYVRDDKAQDYHDMIAHIFSEFEEIQKKGGVRVVLDFGTNKTYDVVVKPVIQFIIGDCKGNDLLCGRKGGHSVKMKGLCRDCNISPDLGDDTCIGMRLKCRLLTKDDIVGKSKEDLDALSFLHINNAFLKLSFGGCRRSIWGATPLEILHALQLGLCEYVAEGLECIFTQSCMDIISNTLVGILSESKRQSERNMPELSAFKLGLMSVKSLKAKERFARVFCVYLSLSNSYCINALVGKKKKSMEGEDHANSQRLTKDYLRGLKNVIEDTILFHQWFKEDEYKRSDFEDGPNGEDCRAQQRIKHYLHNFKTYIIRKGNGLKTPKFHQMLHLIDYIKRHGAPNNWDGSRPEHFGKVFVKDHAKMTNRQRDTLNFDISKRICETTIVDEISRVYYCRNKRWPSEYCNDTDLMESTATEGQHPNANEDERTLSTNEVSVKSPRYHISARLRSNEEMHQAELQDNQARDVFHCSLDWGGRNKIPLFNIPLELQKRLFMRLFVGSPNIGGKVRLTDDSTVRIPCFTEFKVNNVLYRAHPCFSKKGCWYDWAYFDWHGYEHPIAARILMVVDLTDVDLTYQVDLPPDSSVDEDTVRTHQHLTNEKWAIVHAAVSPSCDIDDMTDNHFDSQIHTWIKLTKEEEDLWTVPLSVIVGPCYVVRNRDYVKIGNNGDINDDLTAYVVRPMSQWANQFLPPNQ